MLVNGGGVKLLNVLLSASRALLISDFYSRFLEGDPVSPGKSQKEGQEDHAEVR